MKLDHEPKENWTLTVEPLVNVHRTMEEILPCVHHDNAQEKLRHWNDVPVYGFGGQNLPSCKRWNRLTTPNIHSASQPRIPSSCYRSREQWI
jgi:hypothetical protein